MFCSMSSFPAICDSKGSTWLYSKLSGHTTGWSDVKPSKLVALLSRHADRHHISHTAPVSIGFSLHSTALVSSPSQARNFIGCSRIPGLRALHRSGTWRSKSSWHQAKQLKTSPTGLTIRCLILEPQPSPKLAIKWCISKPSIRSICSNLNRKTKSNIPI